MTFEARIRSAAVMSALLALCCLSAAGGETVFSDDFESTTLTSSPPDTNDWGTTGATWYTDDAECVDTQNHTASGSQSMYSSGGDSGDGIGDWNEAGFGSLVNCRATCWFYDDMATTKIQYVSADNSSGANWLAIMVRTPTSASRYVYYGTMLGGYQVTGIDRSLGWHKVVWVRDSSFTTLFLDDVQVYTTPSATFSNLNTFDLGSWSDDSIDGNTGMWFDDCIVEIGQHQSHYRWYQNNSAESPTAIAAEDTPITGVLSTHLMRLRVQLQNDTSTAWSGSYIGLRYRRGALGEWKDFGSGAEWNYANGMGTDGNVVSNTFLSGTDTAQHFVESLASTPNVSVASGERGEWDFAIQATSTMVAGAKYYFKAVETTSGGAYLRDIIAAPKLAELTTSSANLMTWTGATDDQWTLGGNWSPAGPPGSSSDVLIPLSASRNCRLNTTTTVASLHVESGRSLLLTTADQGLTVTGAVGIYGTVTHSTNSTMTFTNGPVALSGTYTHSGSGSVTATGLTVTIENMGQYDLTGSGATLTCGALTVAAGGDFNQTTAVSTITVSDLTVMLGGEYDCTVAAAAVNIADDLTNNGSMASTTGGAWTFSGSAASITGSSTSTFYDLSVTGDATLEDGATASVLNAGTVDGAGSLTLDGGSILEIASGKTLTANGDFAITGTSLQDDFATIRASSGNYSMDLGGDVDVFCAKIQDLADNTLDLSSDTATTTVFGSVIFETSQSAGGRYLKVSGDAWDGYTFNGLAFDEVGGGPDTTGTVEIDIAGGEITLTSYGKSPTYSSGGGTAIETAGTVTWEPLATTVCDLKLEYTEDGARLSWRALSEWGCVAYRAVKLSPEGARKSMDVIPAGGKVYEHVIPAALAGDGFALEAANSKGQWRQIARFPLVKETMGAGK